MNVTPYTSRNHVIHLEFLIMRKKKLLPYYVTNQALSVHVSVWGERSRRISLSMLFVWIPSTMYYGGQQCSLHVLLYCLEVNCLLVYHMYLIEEVRKTEQNFNMKIYSFSTLSIFSYLPSNHEVSCYNCLASESRALTCDLFEPELAVPVRTGCSTTRSHCALHMLGQSELYVHVNLLFILIYINHDQCDKKW